VHTHNATYSHSARHIAKAGKPRVHLNPDDLQDLQAVEGSLLRLANATGAISLPAVSDSSMPRGMVRVDGLPRACDMAESQGINALVSGQVSDMGGGNVQYSTMVDLTVV
jgi:anaerobic selenocysteine-containing dehydrogenase